MAQTARCPDCDRLVAIPEGADTTARVRCPLCNAVYPLDQVRPGDEEPSDLLPELVPDAKEEPPASPPEMEDAVSSSEAVAESDAPPVGMDLIVRCPHCQAEAKLGELVVANTGQPLDAVTLAEALGATTVETASGLEGASVAWGSLDAISSLEFGPSEAGDVGSPAAALARRRKSSKSVLGQLLGIVLGGLLALPIAYCLLNVIRGEQFDWFHVPLPFAPHTYKHLPDWWPDWAKPSSDDRTGEDAEPENRSFKASSVLEPDSRGLSEQHAAAAASDLDVRNIRPPTSPGLVRDAEVHGHQLTFSFFIGAIASGDEEPVNLICVGHRVQQFHAANTHRMPLLVPVHVRGFRSCRPQTLPEHDVCQSLAVNA